MKTALLTALVAVATMLIKIPSFKGYVNAGDGFVLLCGYLLGPYYGCFAAGLGSALADFLSGYAVYVPVTFVIKGLMALIACGVQSRLQNNAGRIIGGVFAELLMVAGYYVFDSCLYGFLPSAAGIFPNILQGVAGIILSIILMQIFEKRSIKM